MRGLKSQLPSTGTPRLDLGGCVFYAPLWRPDMVARGGSIINGTGTLDVSPQNLAVGANTITATGAGTFIIRVPRAGTCASGTATVAGSPVTLPAGIATTVDTGATTGTITVTTGNIIKSKDSIGHLCTIMDATWGSQGRTFVGANADYINLAADSVMNFISGDFTILVWFKPTTISITQYLFVRGLLSTDGYMLAVHSANRLTFYGNQAGANQQSYSAGSTIANNTWYCGGVARTGTSVRVYLNGKDSTATAGSHTDPLTSARTVKIGVYDNLTGNPWYGLMGELAVFNRKLNASEMMQYYLATKWRYV